MTLSFAFLISFFTVGILQVTAETVQCRYYIDSRYPLDGQQYYCYVKNSEIFAGSRINVDNAIEAHTEGRTSNSQVGAFYTDGPSNMVLFPSNLAQIFPNLIVIDIYASYLTQITSDDLKPFSKIKYLSLQSNVIEIISNDLFSYNPELEVILLNRNHIKHIDTLAFSSLNNLKSLSLYANVCTSLKNANTFNNRDDVLEIIKGIEQGNCL